MAKRRVTVTFNEANYQAIVAHWGGVAEWKTWLKAQTFAALQPASSYPDVYTSEFVD